MKNLHLRNAYYDSFINVFKPTALNNKFESIVKYSKMIPIIGNETNLTVTLNSLHSVPLLQNESRICSLYIKFNTKKKSTQYNHLNGDHEFSLLNSIYFFIDTFKDRVFDNFLTFE